ncbi:MAG TPA: hypothetical protein GXX37_13040 [Clostridiaceae bacterium]|nr:hypothetical protein [Clostridiaceae bacterium]
MYGNLWVLGERFISGKYRRIMAAGGLKIEDSNILKLYSAGEIDIKNSTIKKLRAAGEIKGTNVNLGNVSIAGDIKLTGEVKADVLVACGDLTAEYLSCKVLRNFAKRSSKNNRWVRSGSIAGDGNRTVGEFSGFFKAETFENFKDTVIDFEYEFVNIISKCRLTSLNAIKCERLFSFSQICADEVNADYVYIKPHSTSKISMLAGSEIIISEEFKSIKLFKSLPKSVDFTYYKDILSLPSSIMSVETIEADKIFVEKLKANLISGAEIVIGDLCIIDKVEYSQSIKISPKAVVNEVIKI